MALASLIKNLITEPIGIVRLFNAKKNRTALLFFAWRRSEKSSPTLIVFFEVAETLRFVHVSFYLLSADVMHDLLKSLLVLFWISMRGWKLWVLSDGFSTKGIGLCFVVLRWAGANSLRICSLRWEFMVGCGLFSVVIRWGRFFFMKKNDVVGVTKWKLVIKFR